ncbi:MULTISPECIES: segregation and condensation protein A [Halococcus]|uniref:Chromosome segregation and condensation protein ScpA n=1 Tax=Halococcus salifodinae DSM 8989 TaxID=1227456 RepID=M0NFB5_9EURY|nr:MULTISPECIES: ScpA family protein [Halococcus]EMA55385.1 chromosome segregation and condensation protein ScpA [Halococcus salifodinae DSM 8989]
MTDTPDPLASAGVGSPGDAVDDAGDTGTEADGDADESEEVEPVELLVRLAEEGEIEPWDIDVVEVTDAFLSRLDAADLRTSGRALFYASVLLRMKSDALLEPDEPEPDPAPEPWEEAWGPEDGAADGGEFGPDPVAALEDEMDRRLDRKQARGTPETLDELVRELREAERDSWWKESRTYDTDGSPKGFQRGTQTLEYRSGDDLRVDDEPTEAEVTATAHTEDIETIIADVQRVLRKQYDAGREEVLYAEIEEAGGSRVETFLAVLFLSHRGHVRLEQDELFGDLWIQNPAADTGSTEAIAD